MSRLARAVFAGVIALLLYPILSGLLSGWTFTSFDYIQWATGALIMAAVVYHLTGYKDPPPH